MLIVLHDTDDEDSRDLLGGLLLVGGASVEIQWIDPSRAVAMIGPSDLENSPPRSRTGRMTTTKRRRNGDRTRGGETMPRRTCSVCTSDRRVEIDAAIHRGLFTSEIARRFGFTTPTITGHRRSGHHLLQPRRVSSGPHNASSLLTRIEANLDDPDALAALRIAVGSLAPAEKRVLVAALRRRSGKVAEHVPVRRAA